MKKTISLLTVILLVLSLLTACNQQTGTETKDTEQVEPGAAYVGKSAAFVGDSITYGIGLETLTNQYWMLLKDKLQLGIVNNYGVSGSCVSTQGTRGLERSPLAIRVESIPRTDMIFIFMGTNDFGCSVPIGKIEDNTDVSFYGAWNFVLERLKTKFPDSQIILMTSIPRYSMTVNSLDLTLDAYVDAVKKIGEHHELPVIDLYTIMADEFTEANVDKYMPDKIHPNEEGHALMAEELRQWLVENEKTVFPE